VTDARWSRYYLAARTLEGLPLETTDSFARHARRFSTND